MVVVFDALTGQHYSLPREREVREPGDSVKLEPGARPLEPPSAEHRERKIQGMGASGESPESHRGLVVDLYL